MKTFLTWALSGSQPTAERLSVLTLFLRLFAVIMIPYGLTKVNDFSALSLDFFGNPIGIGHVPSLILTIVAQIGCSALIILGFQTRLCAMILAFNLAVATKFHFFDPFCSTTALPVLCVGLYITLIVLGSGKYSIDALMFRKSSRFSSKYVYNNNDIKVVLCMIAACIITILTFALDFSGITSFMLLLIAGILFLCSFMFCKE